MDLLKNKTKRKTKRNFKKTEHLRKEEQQNIVLASYLAAKRKKFDPPVPNGFELREWGSDYDYILSMLEEEISNASNYGATEFESVVSDLYGEKGYWLLGLHNGLGMTANQIKELACTPLSSERKGSALNGMGITFVGSIAKYPAQVVVASKIDGGEWVAFQGRADYSKGSHWRTESKPNFINALRKRFGKHLDKFNVCYAYPLDIKYPGRLLSVEKVNNLIWQIPHLIGKGETAKGYERNLDGSLRIVFNEGVYIGNVPWGKQDGSKRRVLCPQEEYFERFRDRSFSFPVESFDFEIQKEAGVHISIEKATVHVHSFPVGFKKEDGTKLQWLAALRDGKKYNFSKGSGSGMGRASTYSVFLRFPCLDIEVIDDDGSNIRPFNRFAYKAPAQWEDSLAWMQALNLNFFNPGTKFVIIEMRIEKVQKKTIRRGEFPVTEVIEPMELAGYFGREPDFVFSSRQTCRSLALELCNHVDPIKTEEAKQYFQELFPTPERSFFSINLGNKSYDRVKKNARFDIFNFATADRFTRTAKSGSSHRLGIYDRKNHNWVPNNEIIIPSIYADSVSSLKDLTSSIEFNNIDKKSAQILQSKKSCDNIQIVGISIAQARRKVDGKWVEFTDIKDQYFNTDPNCRPRRAIILNVRGTELRICDINDLPKRNRVGGIKRKITPEDKVGPAPFQPICLNSRHESIVGEMPEKEKYLLLNGEHPLIKKYFYHDLDSVRKYLDPIYWALNAVAHGIKDGTQFFKEGPVVPDEYKPLCETSEGYYSNRWDYVLNVTLRKMLSEDRFILESFAKIDKILEKNAIDQREEEVA